MLTADRLTGVSLLANEPSGCSIITHNTCCQWNLHLSAYVDPWTALYLTQERGANVLVASLGIFQVGRIPLGPHFRSLWPHIQYHATTTLTTNPNPDPPPYSNPYPSQVGHCIVLDLWYKLETLENVYQVHLCSTTIAAYTTSDGLAYSLGHTQAHSHSLLTWSHTASS